MARDYRRALRRAMDLPQNTCPASRHVAGIADALYAGNKYHMLDEEPKHCAESMYATVTALWKARTELAKLKAKRKKPAPAPVKDAEAE